MPLIETNAEGLAYHVRSDTFVLVCFFSPQCTACERVRPIFATLAPLHPEISFIRVNISQHKQVIQEYDVNVVPLFLSYHAGVEIARKEGGDLDGLRTLVEALLSRGYGRTLAAVSDRVPLGYHPLVVNSSLSESLASQKAPPEVDYAATAPPPPPSILSEGPTQQQIDTREAVRVADATQLAALCIAGAVGGGDVAATEGAIDHTTRCDEHAHGLFSPEGGGGANGDVAAGGVPTSADAATPHVGQSPDDQSSSMGLVGELVRARVRVPSGRSYTLSIRKLATTSTAVFLRALPAYLPRDVSRDLVREAAVASGGATVTDEKGEGRGYVGSSQDELLAVGEAIAASYVAVVGHPPATLPDDAVIPLSSVVTLLPLSRAPPFMKLKSIDRGGDSEGEGGGENPSGAAVRQGGKKGGSKVVGGSGRGRGRAGTNGEARGMDENKGPTRRGGSGGADNQGEGVDGDAEGDGERSGGDGGDDGDNPSSPSSSSDSLPLPLEAAKGVAPLVDHSHRSPSHAARCVSAGGLLNRALRPHAPGDEEHGAAPSWRAGAEAPPGEGRPGRVRTLLGPAPPSCVASRPPVSVKRLCVPDDGHCLFVALHTLFTGEALGDPSNNCTTHAHLSSSSSSHVPPHVRAARCMRELVGAAVKANSSTFPPAILGKGSVGEYVESITSGAWGGGIEVAAAVSGCNVAVVVIDVQSVTPMRFDPPSLPEQVKDEGRGKTMGDADGDGEADRRRARDAEVRVSPVGSAHTRTSAGSPKAFSEAGAVVADGSDRDLSSRHAYDAVGYLIYDGIHYDPIVGEEVTPKGEGRDAKRRFVTLFPPWMESEVTALATNVAIAAKSAGAYTDTSTFALRCSVCFEALKGADAATAHAAATKHQQFEEFCER